ncbi:MAG: PQQ-like beta-propeller repeat protein [Saprospiraceae bacterium]|nr:PQQ-like beta-propeller repeat protein [Saprospiraceae bacterium]
MQLMFAGLLLILSFLVFYPKESNQNYSNNFYYYDKKYLPEEINYLKLIEYFEDDQNLRYPIIGNSNSIYYSCLSKGLVAYNYLNSERQWSREISGGIKSSPVFYNGSLFVRSSDKLYKLEISTGKIFDSLLVKRVQDELVEESYLLANINEFIVFGTGEFLYSIDSKRFAIIDSINLQTEIQPFPSILDNKIFISSRDSEVICLNLVKGYFSKVWTKTLDNPCCTNGVIDSNIIYISDEVGTLYLLNEEDGVIISKIHLEGKVYCNVIVKDTNIFIPVTDIFKDSTEIIRISRQRNNELFINGKVTIKGSVLSNGILINNYLFIPSYGILYKIDIISLKFEEVSFANIGSDFMSISVYNGFVFLNLDGGKVYNLKIPMLN